MRWKRFLIGENQIACTLAGMDVDDPIITHLSHICHTLYFQSSGGHLLMFLSLLDKTCSPRPVKIYYSIWKLSWLHAQLDPFPQPLNQVGQGLVSPQWHKHWKNKTIFQTAQNLQISFEISLEISSTISMYYDTSKDFRWEHQTSSWSLEKYEKNTKSPEI